MRYFFALLMSGILAASSFSMAVDSSPQKLTDVTIRGTVHSIVLPEAEPELPAGKSRGIVQFYCSTCHTSQYIMIQPRFSQETWVAEINKMRKTFSAPIPDDKVKEIENYLMAVRGPVAK